MTKIFLFLIAMGFGPLAQAVDIPESTGCYVTDDNRECCLTPRHTAHDLVSSDPHNFLGDDNSEDPVLNPNYKEEHPMVWTCDQDIEAGHPIAKIREKLEHSQAELIRRSQLKLEAQRKIVGAILQSDHACVKEPKPWKSDPYGQIKSSVVAQFNGHQDLLKVVEEGTDSPLTVEQYIAIDAFARTLLGEMGVCANKTKLGDGYMLAVAQVVMNRAKAATTNDCAAHRYADSDHAIDSMTTAIPKTLFAGGEFSMWNPTSKITGYQKQFFCPNAVDQKKAPSALAWKNAIRIATTAVLHPEELAELTKGLEHVYFYTSGIPRRDGSKELSGATAHGIPLDIRSCTRFWSMGSAKDAGENCKTPHAKPRRGSNTAK